MNTWYINLVVLVSVSCRACAQEKVTQPQTIEPPADTAVELTFVQQGTTYKLFRGGIYRVDKPTGRWQFVTEGYDPAFYEKNYVERDGVIFRKGDRGKLHRVRKQFADDFEDADTIGDLIGIERGWTSFTLQSPKAPTVQDYVRLRKRILTENAAFLDNRIEPSEELAHTGRQALKAYCVPRVGDAVTNKASLSTELLHFVKGDDVWFTGWFYVPAESGMPFTLMDLETTWFKQYPGIRIMLYGSKHLGVELKWATKPQYRQSKSRAVPFPHGRWVHVKFHTTLSEKSDGVVELWQDGTKIVDARGQTLPLPHTIYNSLEVGISAHSLGQVPATLFTDDISISNAPPQPLTNKTPRN